VATRGRGVSVAAAAVTSPLPSWSVTARPRGASPPAPPEEPVLLAVNQEFGEGTGLLQDPIQMPAIGDAFQFLLSSVLEDEA
jgi:hypothetical protein